MKKNQPTFFVAPNMGRTFNKFLGSVVQVVNDNLLSTDPIFFQQVFAACPVGAQIEDQPGNLHIRYQDTLYCTGQEAAQLYGISPNTSDMPYFQGDALSPEFYACFWTGIEKIISKYPVQEETHLRFALTLPEAHLEIKERLRSCLLGPHYIEFDTFSRKFVVEEVIIVHEPKGLLYCDQFFWDGKQVRQKPIQEGQRYFVVDLGSVTLCSALYTWFYSSEAKGWYWKANKEDFRQSKQGHWSLLEKYRSLAWISPQEDVWRLMQSWQNEEKEMKQAVIRQHLPALNILDSKKPYDVALVGGGGWYDLKDSLPFEARLPESSIGKKRHKNAEAPLPQKAERCQVEGNWKLLLWAAQQKVGVKL